MNKFPIFRNGGIVKGLEDLDTEDIDPRVALAKANNERERGIASQYFHSTPSIGNLLRAGYHYWKSDPFLGGESENPDMITGVAPSPGLSKGFYSGLTSNEIKAFLAMGSENVGRIVNYLKKMNLNPEQLRHALKNIPKYRVLLNAILKNLKFSDYEIKQMGIKLRRSLKGLKDLADIKAGKEWDSYDRAKWIEDKIRENVSKNGGPDAKIISTPMYHKFGGSFKFPIF